MGRASRLGQPSSGVRSRSTSSEKGRVLLGIEGCADRWAHYRLEEKSLDRLLTRGRLWSEPAADQGAFYYVFSRWPLRLVHIHVGDGFTVHPALIRGLRWRDVEDDAQGEEGPGAIAGRGTTNTDSTPPST